MITTDKEVIVNAVNNLVNFVKPTYGARGKKVIISNQHYTIAIDDGVKIANAYTTPLPEEQAVVNIIKQAANHTNLRVGDGTTSSLILLQAIVNHAKDLPSHEVEPELRKGLHEVITALKNQAITISSKEDLKRVALMSFNDDHVADIISTILYEVGSDGLITVDEHEALTIDHELINGLQLSSGFASPYFVTDTDKVQAVVENPLIYVTNQRLTKMQEVKDILDKAAQSGNKSVVIVADKIEGDALTMCFLNKLKSGFNIIATTCQNKMMLEDLCYSTGAKMVTDMSTNIVFGLADCVKSTQTSTLFIGTQGDTTNIETFLKEEIAKSKIQSEKEVLQMRLARLTNGIAQIKVGALTESERTALREKIEDAVNATRTAQKSGVVCGAGLTLASITTSSPILNHALQAPSKQLGITTPINLVTGEEGNFFDIGLIDPVEVIIAGLESAISIAIILLTTEGIIYEEKKENTFITRG